jgi:hypothetical protein
VQRITQQETGGRIDKLILLNQKKEEEFASCSYRKTPYLVPGTTCVFFSMVVPGTKFSQKKFEKFLALKKGI